jgi:dihydrofolate reductase
MLFLDDALGEALRETIAGEFDMLLGRRTYEIFAAYWPKQGNNRIAKAFNKGWESRASNSSRSRQPRGRFTTRKIRK